MTIVDMLQQSLFLTLLGMGVVFSFLIILIVFMTLSHKVLHALKLDQEAVEPQKPSAAPVTSGQDGAVIAAIAAAIREKQR
ncbi:MAG: OadG family protein [Spirochaetaceae bacterium]|nr:OadG family protein [Spirochaetaceae bacterium]